jgi:DNA polymerase III subunit gamma/tau
MEKYQIIPRKFRPKRFAEVFGHAAIVTTLKNALRSQNVGQAYLFCGMRGCGKTTLARIFAKALNCEALAEGFEPCNACVSCLEIAGGRSLDLIEIDGASNRGIDDIRKLNETVGYAPSRGKYKIYIIDEVHMLTKEAFNALLKTLEEPPKNVKFFFATTEPHKVLPTILSRCQRFSLGRIPEKELTQKLQHICTQLGVAAEEEALSQIGHLAEGSLRDAESLLDQLICYGKSPLTLSLTREVFGLISNDYLFELDEAIHTHSSDKAFQLAKELYSCGKDLNFCLDSLYDHFRTYLGIHLGEPLKAPYAKWAKEYTKERCLTLLDTLMQWQQSLSKTTLKQIHLEMLFATLVQNVRKISLNGLIERLLELEERLKEPKRESIEPPPPEEKVVETIQEEPPPPIEEPVVEPPQEEQTPPPKEEIIDTNNLHPSRVDTLIRFAAVELQGSVQQSLGRDTDG